MTDHRWPTPLSPALHVTLTLQDGRTVVTPTLTISSDDRGCIRSVTVLHSDGLTETIDATNIEAFDFVSR